MEQQWTYTYGGDKVKRRRGNLVITMIAMLFSALLIFSMLSFAQAQKIRAKTRMNSAAEVENFSTLGHFCASAFKDDLEVKTATYPVATLEDPQGTQVITFDTYNAIVTMMQNAMKSGEPQDTGRWRYVLSDMMAPVEFTPIKLDNEAVDLLKELTQDAKMSMSIEAPLTVSRVFELDEAGGGSVFFDDITIDIVIEKGAFKLVQQYVLSDELLVTVFDEGSSTLYCNVSGSHSKLQLVSQTVTTNNKMKSGDAYGT